MSPAVSADESPPPADSLAVALPSARSTRFARAALPLILLLAAALRIPGLTQAPPGLNQDEAVNAWSAWCLLKTGHDQAGVAWPIFYTRALGENRSALFLYVLLPFQALGGLNVWTTRLPAATAGLLTIFLVYWVGRRLFDRPTGLAAALLLTLSPTHVQMSRWGHEACLTPLLVLAPLAALLWAGFPIADGSPRPRPLRAVLAGLLIGVCCYGYPAARLFLPVWLIAIVLASLPAWWAVRRSRAGLGSLVGLFVAVAVTFGPLLFQHIFHGEQIARRAEMTWIWGPGDSGAQRVAKVIDRYTSHFEPHFLFADIDADEIAWTTGFGFLSYYLIPLLVIGAALLLPKFPRSRSARAVLLGVLLFPAGDCLNWHISLHGLRSSAGLLPWMLLAGYGLARALAFASARTRRASLVATVAALAAMVVPETAHFATSYFIGRRAQLAVYTGNAVDLLEACDWLRPRLEQIDAVICTALGMNQPYLATLVAFGYDPHAWFAHPAEMRRAGDWDYCTHYGKFYFLQPWERADVLAGLDRTRPHPRVVFLLRPAEPPPAEPTHNIIGPDGKPSLVIYDTTR